MKNFGAEVALNFEKSYLASMAFKKLFEQINFIQHKYFHLQFLYIVYHHLSITVHLHLRYLR